MTDVSDPTLNDETSGSGLACVMHASCVAYGERAVLIKGPSGAGKSSLALQLMALGAVLVADDKTCLRKTEGGLLAMAPAALKGLIEARGVGILTAETCDTAIVRLIVDLEQVEVDRLPPRRSDNLLGQTLPVLHNVRAAHFAAAILQYLKGGRNA